MTDADARAEGAPVPGEGRSHVPSGRPLWSLAEDALVEFDADADRLTVHCRWGVIEVADRSLLVREVLHRMSLGPVSLEHVPGLQEPFRNWKRGAGGCGGGEWQRVKRALDKLGGCVTPSLGIKDGGGPILTVTAVSLDAVFSLPVVEYSHPVRLRPLTVMKIIECEPTLVCPGLPYQVVLCRLPALRLARSLLEGTSTVAELAASLQLDPPLVADIVAYLSGADLVVPDPRPTLVRPNGGNR